MPLPIRVGQSKNFCNICFDSLDNGSELGEGGAVSDHSISYPLIRSTVDLPGSLLLVSTIRRSPTAVGMGTWIEADLWE